ncbi:MAG: DNA polymerase III subunit delta [Pseudomonadota bacterium]
MTALKGKAVKAFLDAPDKTIAAVLVYGPDAGLARERATMLAKRIAPDLQDPFNAIELTDADLKDEPARLADEITALSFVGGERVVRLRTNGEASAKAAAALIKGLDAGHLKANGLVIIEAGDLSPRSGLRKSFEKATRAAALPCYADGPADIRDLARACARAEDLRFEDDALDFVIAALGDDHGLSRAEIDKLILYKGPKDVRRGPGTITLEDARACLADGPGSALDDAANAAADGAPAALSKALYRAQSAGTNPIALLRAMQRQMTRLSAAKGFMERGDSAAAAMKKLKPPVFFAEQRAFENRLFKWPLSKLDVAVRMLIETELDAKTTGAPQRELVERAALRIALMGKG